MIQILATIVALLSLQDVFNNFLNDVANSLPGVIGAIIIVIIGVIAGWFVAKIVNRVVNNTVEKNFDKSTVGKTFRESGFDLSSFVAGVVEAFIIIISITVAIGLLNIQGAAGSLLAQVAASLIGSIIKPMFGAAKAEIADMLKNLLFIGLVAVILNIAFDMLQFSSGSLVYSLIIGFVIIGAGVILTDGLIKSITDDHQEFAAIAGYAKFVLYSIFLLIGAGAIFSTFTGVTGIISTVAWGFAIAFAIVLIPIVYGLAKRMQAETK